MSSVTSCAAVRLALGSELYVAVPAGQTRALAHLLHVGLREIGRRDGIAAPSHLLDTLALLEAVGAERALLLAGHRESSNVRTPEPHERPASALWRHDEITVAEAAALTGWSAGYLCRLARRGFGRKEAGSWRLDREELLQLKASRGATWPADYLRKFRTR